MLDPYLIAAVEYVTPDENNVGFNEPVGVSVGAIVPVGARRAIGLTYSAVTPEVVAFNSFETTNVTGHVAIQSLTLDVRERIFRTNAWISVGAGYGSQRYAVNGDFMGQTGTFEISETLSGVVLRGGVHFNVPKAPFELAAVYTTTLDRPYQVDVTQAPEPVDTQGINRQYTVRLSYKFWLG